MRLIIGTFAALFVVGLIVAALAVTNTAQHTEKVIAVAQL